MHIAIWGTGKTGRYIKEQSKNNKNIDIKYFVDNDITKQNQYIDGRLVLSGKGLKEVYLQEEIDVVIIAVLDMGYVNSIILQLQFLGIERIGFLQGRVTFKNTFDWTQILWKQYTTKPILPYLETNVMDSCNLKCQGCTHFANLFNEESYVEFDVFKRDLNQIADNLNVLQFRLLGGEPLMNKNLTLYIQEARKCMPNSNIRIVTNGILIPDQDADLFDCMNRNKVGFDISLYQPTLKMQDKIIETLVKYNVEYKFSDEIKMFYKTLNKYGNSTPSIAHENCYQNHCAFFRNGKIYKCPYASLIDKYKEYFQLEKEFVHEASFDIDLYDASVDWKKTIENLQKPIGFCKYCAEQGGDFFLWTVSKNPDENEWIMGKSDL